eukprot:SAG31_NODE_716_length_12626_cov_7.493973_6_plen_197_part_00
MISTSAHWPHETHQEVALIGPVTCRNRNGIWHATQTTAVSVCNSSRSARFVPSPAGKGVADAGAGADPKGKRKQQLLSASVGGGVSAKGKGKGGSGRDDLEVPSAPEGKGKGGSGKGKGKGVLEEPSHLAVPPPRQHPMPWLEIVWNQNFVRDQTDHPVGRARSHAVPVRRLVHQIKRSQQGILSNRSRSCFTMLT